MDSKDDTSAPMATAPSKESAQLRATWGSLFNFTTRSHLPTLIFSLIFALAAGLVLPALAVILGSVFDIFASFSPVSSSLEDLLQEVVGRCVQLVGLGAVSWFLSSGYFAFFTAFGEQQAGNARNKVFSELLKRDVEWFQMQQDGTGAFLSVLQAQIHELRGATSQPLAFAFHYTFRGLASLALAFYTSWNLALVTLAGIPIFSGIVVLLSSKIQPSIEAQQLELSSASKIANNAITSIATVKCLNVQESECRKFFSRIESAALHYLKQARVNSIQMGLVRLMGFSLVIQAFWYGHTLKVAGKLSSGEVLRTFWACIIASQCMEQVLSRLILLEKGKVAGAALKRIVENRPVDAVEGISDNEMREKSYPPHCKGDIEVSNLSFAYPSQPEIRVLESVNLFFPAGETTYIIGKSGSGKSTLGQLLMRFYSPSSGEIAIDGIPIQTLDINWVRNNITLVEQRSVLFHESMLTNIALGQHDFERVRKEDVQESVDLAMLQNVISGLPHGINTSVGPGGSFLSGGQRQRVAIARARLRDTPILIMDEPTSALDFANRNAVMKALRKWRKGKTTIIITHDISQILDQDFVYVLEHGSVIHSGYKNELENIPELDKYFSSGDKEVNSADNGDNADSADESSSSGDSAMDVPLSLGGSLFYGNKHKIFEDAYTQGARLRVRSDIQDFNRQNLALPIPRRNSYLQRDRISKLPRMSMLEFDISQTVESSTKNRSLARQNIPSIYSYPMERLTDMPSQASMSQRQVRKRDKLRFQEVKMLSLCEILLTIIPSLTGRQRLVLVAGFLSAFLHGAATPISAYFISQLFESFFNSSTQMATKWVIYIIGIAIIDSSLDGTMHGCLEYCGQAWVDSLRKRAFHKILDQPLVWFEKDRNRPLKLTACLDRNGEEMKGIVGKFAGFIVVIIAISAISITWSLVVCWRVTFVTLSSGPVLYAVTKGFQVVTGLWEKRCNEAYDVASAVFAETFSEICTVRTLTLEPYFHRKSLKAASNCMKTGFKRAAYTGVVFGITDSLNFFVSALVIYYGTLLITSWESTVDDVLTVVSMLLFSIGYASLVLSLIPQVSTSRDTAAQILRLVNLSEGVSHEYLGQLEPVRMAPVTFSHVHFKYPSRPDVRVLRDASFVIHENSCTAIVGRSGSGKSTIASLLLSLYEAPASRRGASRIAIGDVDIRELHTPILRSLISVVSQQPMLFPDTIRANISYGLGDDSPLNTMHNIEAAARAAGIDEFISSLPSGYSTMIGDGGTGLSGGQAQRVVIARALARRPRILILDEATSALDAESAEIIRRTVTRLVASRKDLTVIIITHSKEMMEIADSVIMLEEGEVVEQGPYQELARRSHGKLRALIETPEE